MPVPIALALVPILQALGMVGGGEAFSRQREERAVAGRREETERADLRKAFEIYAANPTMFTALPGGPPTGTALQVPVAQGPGFGASGGQMGVSLPPPPAGSPQANPLFQLLKSMDPTVVAGQREAEAAQRGLTTEIAKGGMNALKGLDPNSAAYLAALLGGPVAQAQLGEKELVQAERLQGGRLAQEERLQGGRLAHQTEENRKQIAAQLQIAGMPARGGEGREDPGVKRFFDQVERAENQIGSVLKFIAEGGTGTPEILANRVGSANRNLFDAYSWAANNGGNRQAIAETFAQKATLLTMPTTKGWNTPGGIPATLAEILLMTENEQARYRDFTELAKWYHVLGGKRPEAEPASQPQTSTQDLMDQASKDFGF